ncbi:phosphoribosyl transferase [Candidatus Uhrbacteria bacterium]|nr:phosphoribosyl transferase [Candidatus Uhrbacteria bacterium]
MTFRSRAAGAKELAEALIQYKDTHDTVVVALPRGGIVVGRVIADALGLPLDIVVPRKIGYPGNEEYAIGAITETGDTIWNEDEYAHTDKKLLTQNIEKAYREAKRRLSVYRKGMKERDWRGKIILLVDDGIATGLTMRAAIKSVKTLGAETIIVAVPGGPADTIDMLKKESSVHEVVVLEIPDTFYAVGQLYEEFGQVEDNEVITLLNPLFYTL